MNARTIAVAALILWHAPQALPQASLGDARLPMTGAIGADMPSGEHAAAARAMVHDLDYSTGRLSLTFPLYSMRGSGVKLDLAISCQTGGLKVEEEPGMAGVGWAFEAGGFVARTVVGRPDEEVMVAGRPFDPEDDDMDEADCLASILRGETDSGCDRYVFHAGGIGGQFVIRGAQVVQLPSTDCRIVKAGGGFRVTTPDGILYEYEPDEQTEYAYNNPYATGIVRHPEYGPVTTRWRLRKVCNPQRTDSIVLSYEPSDGWLQSRTRRTETISCSVRSGFAGSLNQQEPGLPESSGHFSHTCCSRLASVSWREGVAEFRYGAPGSKTCVGFDVKDLFGTPILAVALEYVPGGVRMAGKNRALLRGYTITGQEGPLPLAGATFRYWMEGCAMDGTDLFGYCNGSGAYYQGVLCFEDGQAVNPGALSLSQARRPNPAFAVANSLMEVQTLSGALYSFEYEGSSVPSGWSLLGSDSQDLSIGLRLKRETETDLATGWQCVRELSYEGAVSSIPMSPIGPEAFVSVGGTSTTFNSIETLTTGATLLAQSRLSGAAIEDAGVYYSRVTEKVSGTGMERAAIRTCEYDAAMAQCDYVPHGFCVPQASPQDKRFCGTHASWGNDFRNLSAVLRPMPTGGYFRETAGGKAPLTKVTEWRIEESGDTVPARVTTCKWTAAPAQAVPVQLYCESMVRTIVRFGIPTETFLSESDFDHYVVECMPRRLFLDTLAVREIALDGSSRLTTTAYRYNFNYPWPALPEGQLWPGAYLDNGLLASAKTWCGNDTVEVERRYACSSFLPAYSPIAEAGWIALPVSQKHRRGASSTIAEHVYRNLGALGWRLSSTHVKDGSGIVLDRKDVLAWDGSGMPARVSYNGDCPEAYEWDRQGMRVVASTVGGRLTTRWSYLPLVGLESETRPSGLVTEWGYQGGRVAWEKEGGTTTRTHAYGLQGATVSDFYANVQSSVEICTPSPDYAVLSRADAFGRPLAHGLAPAGDLGQAILDIDLFDALGRITSKCTPASGDIDLGIGTEPAPFGAWAYEYPASFQGLPSAFTLPGQEYAGHPAVTETFCNKGIQAIEARYYDGYSFFQMPEFWGLPFAPASNMAGLQTGSLTRAYGTGALLACAVSYDGRERPVQAVRALLGGGSETVSMTYDNAGRPLQTTTSVSRPGYQPAVVVESREYDGYGRLASVNEGMGPASSACSYGYDDKGRLESLDCGDVLSLGYEHALRGAVASITKDGADFMSLSYSGLYNGGASGLSWIGADGISRSYAYEYDKFGRLVGAGYSESGRRGPRGDYSCEYAYSKSSSPTAIRRYGLLDVFESGPRPVLDFGLVDDLSIEYDGMLPVAVEDAAEQTIYAGAPDFADGAHHGYEMEYDPCGRLVRDDNRGIDSVAYNRLGLPMLVRLGDGSEVRSFYGADGRLHRRIVSTPVEFSSHPGLLGEASFAESLPQPGQLTMSSDTVDYRGPLIYRNGSLCMALTSSGYISRDTAYYYVRDLQGSVRQVVSGATGDVVQENHYYPYGGLFGESSAMALGNGNGANLYRFAGKELIDVMAMAACDFPARWYDPTLGMFWGFDPLTEIDMSLSPLAFCNSDPINYQDPTGLSTWVEDEGHGKYRVLGGNLDNDLNIYIGHLDHNNGFVPSGKVLGRTLTPYSFYDSGNVGEGKEEEFVKGVIIDTQDLSGLDFLQNIRKDTPYLISYGINARNRKKYDFKTKGDDEVIDKQKHYYRGMPFNRNVDNPIYASARDIGNYGAGYVGDKRGLTWDECRLGFDGYQMFSSHSPFVIEGKTSESAQHLGYKEGYRGSLENFISHKWNRLMIPPFIKNLPMKKVLGRILMIFPRY